jgi:hypothetical protein
MADVFDQLDEAPAAAGDVFDQLVPAQGDVFDEVASEAAPGLSQIKLSPYEQLDIASMERGQGKPPTGMESGTELTAALAAELPGKVERTLTWPGKMLKASARDLIASGFSQPQYGGNVGALLRGQEMPSERFIGEAAQYAPNLAVAANIGGGVTEMAPLVAMGALPAWANRLIAAGFTLEMIKGAPEQARQLGEQLGLPKDQQDAGKIARLKSGLIQTAVFAPLAGAGALSKPIETGLVKAGQHSMRRLAELSAEEVKRTGDSQPPALPPEAPAVPERVPPPAPETPAVAPVVSEVKEPAVEAPPLLKGDHLVTVERTEADGSKTLYLGAFDPEKNWELPDKTGQIRKTPQIHEVVAGRWSSGMLGSNERIIEDGGKSGAAWKKPEAPKPAEPTPAPAAAPVEMPAAATRAEQQVLLDVPASPKARSQQINTLRRYDAALERQESTAPDDTTMDQYNNWRDRRTAIQTKLKELESAAMKEAKEPTTAAPTPFPSLLEYAKSKLPKPVADKISE